MIDISKVVIVVDNGDLSFFKTLQDAENCLEPIDVKNNEYVIYDSKGRLLTPSVIVEERPGLFNIGKVSVEVVKIEPEQPQSTGNESFGSVLKKYVSQYIIPDSLASKATVQELLQTAITKATFTQ